MKENVKMVAINIGALEASLGQIGESSLAKSLKHLLGDLHDAVESEAEEISSRIRSIIKLLQCIKLKEQTPDFVMYRVIKNAFNALNELVEDHIGFDDDLERDLLLFGWNESVIDILDEIVSDREALLFSLTIAQAESFDDTHSTDTYVDPSMCEGICPAFLGGFDFDKEAYNALMKKYANEITPQNLLTPRHNTEDKKPPLGFVEHNGHLLPHNFVYGLLGLSLCSPAKSFRMSTDLAGLSNIVMGDDEGTKGLAVKKEEKQEEKKITAGVDFGVSENNIISFHTTFNGEEEVFMVNSYGMIHSNVILIPEATIEGVIKKLSEIHNKPIPTGHNLEKIVHMLGEGLLNKVEIKYAYGDRSVVIIRGGIIARVENAVVINDKLISDTVNISALGAALTWMKGDQSVKEDVGDDRIKNLKFLHDCRITFDIPRLLHVLLCKGTIDINTSSLNRPTNINTMVELAAYLANRFNIEFGVNVFNTHVDLIHLIMDIIEVNGGLLNIEVKKDTHLRYHAGGIVAVMTPSGAIMKVDYKIQEGNVKSQKDLFIEVLKQIHIGEVK